jgi:hypothetical protein
MKMLPGQRSKWTSRESVTSSRAYPPSDTSVRMSEDRALDGERQRSASSSTASTMALKAARQVSADRRDSAAG